MNVWGGVKAALQRKEVNMFINKIGMEHLESGMNCQDYGYENKNKFSLICDGCSQGKHSEVGAKIFCHLRKERMMGTDQSFETAIHLFGDLPSVLKDYMSFTILELMEWENLGSVVTFCGDGYIILQDHDGNITFEELSDGEYPKYYIYNYIPPEYLKHYKDGVSFSQKTYSKEKYAKVGIASDGLRYILQADEELREEFINCLKSGKELKTKLFINRNHKIFKDDVTIVF